MKKIVLSVIFMVSSLLAVNIEPFVGLDIGVSNGSFQANTPSGNVNIDGDSESLGFKIGAILNEKHRIYLSFSEFSPEHDLEYGLAAINYDYLIPVKSFFILMVGAHIGYGESSFFLGYEDQSEVNYGLQFGVLKDITENISLELGYKYTFIDNEGSKPTGGTLIQEDISTASFGINYKF